VLDGELTSFETYTEVYSDRTHMCVRGWRVIYQQHGCTFPYPLLYHRWGVCLVPGREDQYTMDAHEEHRLKKVTEREVRGWHDTVVEGFDGLTEAERRERAYRQLDEALGQKVTATTSKWWGDPDPSIYDDIERQRRYNAELKKQADFLSPLRAAGLLTAATHARLEGFLPGDLGVVPEFNRRYRAKAKEDDDATDVE